jgi:hypothetical protein
VPKLKIDDSVTALPNILGRRYLTTRLNARERPMKEDAVALFAAEMIKVLDLKI